MAEAFLKNLIIDAPANAIITHTELKQIENKQFVFDYFCDFFTEKFIKGEYQDTDITISFDEMEKCLLEITIKDTLYSLTKEGIVNVVEDENNEEQFFLTGLGKNIAKKLDN